MDYAKLADRHITRAAAASGDYLDTAQAATIDALTGIGWALLHLAETVARLEQ